MRRKRNHLSKRKRARRHRRIAVMVKERCATCRRRLDALFRYDRKLRPHCSRHV